MDRQEIDNLAELLTKDYFERLDDVLLIKLDNDPEITEDAFRDMKESFTRIIQKLDATTPPTCVRCGGVGNKTHTCPYAEEIDDDYESTCTCCDDCVHECMMDI